MAQIFNTYSEFVMPIGILTNKTNAEISIHLLTAETKIRKLSK